MYESKKRAVIQNVQIMHGSTRLNVLYEMLVKKGGGLRMTTNTGTVSAVPRTLPKLARS